ncbi:hypothetical protein PhCBS80983_g04262 [Powellomyces hirtus]|uniref:RPA-interacting protein N-terminal domain-containing protein n=1 Tax=Powellomyces hirtus TaxID=109895 RepID=A0A507DYX5_9FUNG|nr:hypothetical protein PhCBS80983_g04262 [Powellomyces hirtus]
MNPPRTPVKPQFSSRNSSPLNLKSPSRSDLSPNTLAWRDRFKAQCLSTLKESRQAEFMKRRFGNPGSPLGKKRWEENSKSAAAAMEEEWTFSFIADQWRLFRMQSRAQDMLPPELEDEIMREVGAASQRDEDLLATYEASLAADLALQESLLLAAQSDLGTASSPPVCFVCQNGVLTLIDNRILCPTCGMTVEAGPHMQSPEALLNHVQQLWSNHQ